MKIAIIGYGTMGKEIEKQAKILSHQVTRIIDVSTENQIYNTSFDEDEVAIEFSQPNSVIENLECLLDKKVNVVCGTTGWHKNKSYIRQLVNKNKVGFLYATNFAIGTNIFWKTLEKSAQYINKFSEYDVMVNEIHHRMKLDSPSGTGVTTAEVLLKNIDRKKSINMDKIDGRIKDEEIHLSSARCGSVVGEHTVIYDSPHDTIRVSHIGKDRASYAIGAIKCAEWLQKKRGFFSISDYIKDIIKE